ncbi:MAG: DUF3467 domain-containing protein [Candidatus Freyarchaeum deiterrae]
MDSKSVPKFVYESDNQKLGLFSNVVAIAFSNFTVNFDFALRAGDEETARVVAALVMNPADAKAFFKNFEESLKKFEKKFGKIKPASKK